MNLDPAEIDEALEAMVSAVDETGTMLLAGLDRPKIIAHKGDVDLVTDYDRRAQDMISQRLSDRFPGIAILAEEGAFTSNTASRTQWIIDPLDGTTNYSHGHPMFAISVGLEHEQKIVAGVISIPALGTRYWARTGSGAFCNGRSIKVSQTRILDHALVATGFPYDRRSTSDDNTHEFGAFMKVTQGVRRCGAAAIDLALVASGVYDGFWEPKLHAWDLAAGALLVEEAGGRTSDYLGDPLDIRAGWIVASNSLIHSEMLDVIRLARDSI